MPDAVVAAGLVTGALAVVALVRVPLPALLVWILFGLVLGLLAWIWRWCVSGSAISSGRSALRSAALGIGASLALAGLVLTFGSATVVALPVLYLAVGGYWLWTRLRSRAETP